MRSFQKTAGTLLLAGMTFAGTSTLVDAETIDMAQRQVMIDGNSAAAPGATLTDSSSVSTGDDSYAQFSSDNAMFRAGSKTDVFLRENRNDLDLKQGIMLVSTEKNGRFSSGSATVHTPEVRSRVKGTMQVSYRPQEYVKIVCIEGTVTVKLKATFGESVTLPQGQMLIINPSEKRLPEPVEIDLQRLITTAVLLSERFPDFSWSGRIGRVASVQAELILSGAVAPTQLVLIGDGLQVTEDFERAVERQRDEVEVEPAPDGDGDGGGGTPTPGGGEDPRNRQGTVPYYVDDSTEFSPDNVRSLRSGRLPAEVTGGESIAGDAHGPKEWLFLVENNPDESPDLIFEQSPTVDGIGSDFDVVEFSTDGDLTVRGELDVAQGIFSANGGELILSSRGRISLEEGSAISTLEVSESHQLTLLNAPALRLEQFSGGEVMVSNASLTSSVIDILNIEEGESSANISLEGAILNSPRANLQAGGSLRITAMSELIGSAFTLSGRTVTIADSSIMSAPDSVNGNGGIEVRAAEVIDVDGSLLSSEAGDVQLQSSDGAPVTINIQNSSQLLALAQGAATTLNSSGGNISISGSRLEAGNSLLLDTRDPGMDAMISIRDSSLLADLVKARAFNSGGRDAILIDNSTIDAGALLRLYAEGSSTLRFRNNVNLKTELAQLAGKTVEVDAGGNVIVDGVAEIYSDRHNYNKDSFGSIKGRSVKQSRYSDRPAF